MAEARNGDMKDFFDEIRRKDIRRNSFRDELPLI
jgi:hypothetical protein